MDGEQKVIVTNFDMPFTAMVSFMVKWALAAIPAIIILGIFFLVLSVLFGGCIAGLAGLAQLGG